VAFSKASQVLGTSTGYAAPRTILGFFGIVLLLVVSGGVAAIGFLARHSALYYLIPDVLLGVVLFAVLEFVAVIAVALTDPTRLMLGQITGGEFIEAQLDIHWTRAPSTTRAYGPFRLYS
jgi:hypothetical protein